MDEDGHRESDVAGAVEEEEEEGDDNSSSSDDEYGVVRRVGGGDFFSRKRRARQNPAVKNRRSKRGKAGGDVTKSKPNTGEVSKKKQRESLRESLELADEDAVRAVLATLPQKHVNERAAIRRRTEQSFPRWKTEIMYDAYRLALPDFPQEIICSSGVLCVWVHECSAPTDSYLRH